MLLPVFEGTSLLIKVNPGDRYSAQGYVISQKDGD